jgi:serine/threonine protein kinase
MAASEPAERAEPRMSGEGAALAWLDALVGGSCTAEEFLAAVNDEIHGNSDAAWELLSRLDQYYRRGKVKTDTFLMLKSRIEDSALDGDEDVSASLAATVAARLAATASPRSHASSTLVTAPVTASQAKVSPDSRAAAPRSAAPRSAANQTAAPQAAAPQATASLSTSSPAAAPQVATPQSTAYQAAAPQATTPQSTAYQAAAPQATAPQSTAYLAAAPQGTPPQAAAYQAAAPQAVPRTGYQSAAPQPAAPQSTAYQAAAPREVAIGDLLRNRYRIVGVLGRGGMGTVFEAMDEYRVDLPTTSQRLAVKVLHSAVAHREELLAELQREFQHLQLLSHPNVVRVHEFDRDGDIAFFTMEFLNGALLSQVLNARKGLALARPHALAIMRDSGAALAHAHSRGVVHGDINPQNIFITNGGELRVLDFGASHKMPHDGWTMGGEWAAREPVATPGYASCQLLEGQYPDARDDVFAFACVAYVLLSGRHPFPNRTAVEACAQNLRPPRPPGITGHQWSVLREGLRWEREHRPADIGEWLDRFGLAGAARQLPNLPLIVNTPMTPKLNFKRVAAGILVVALLAAVGLWAVSNYDSLVQQVTAWTGRARSAVEDADKLPTVTGPVTADQAPAPAAAPPPAAPAPTTATQASPPAAVSTAPASRANSTLSALTAAPIPPAHSAAARPVPTPKAQPTSVARTSAGNAAARTANAGPTRIELAADTVDVQAPDTTASIVVNRKGNLHGDAPFTWWTESGTAKPGQDFTPIMPREGQIESGSASVSLSIPVSGAPRTKPKSFYVVIDRTDSGPALAGRTLTMVTLQPPD